MNINTLTSKRWIVGIFAFLLLLFAFFPVQADSPVTEPDTDEAEAAENAIFLPIVPFGTQSSVDPTATPSAAPTKSPTPPPPGYPAGDTTYYISPAGDDSRSGLSEAEAWATFALAWQRMRPGDSLVLMDGVYYQSLDPGISGQAGNPITIKAHHDGKAIIDGQRVRDPVYLRGNRHFFIIEGIVAKNGNTISGNGNVIKIESDYNIFRRVSAYDANTDANSTVIRIPGDYNLVEDCVAYGTGRKMIMTMGAHNTIRRCFADWRSWDGRDRSNCWPWGDGIEIYNGDYNIIENSISYSRNPTQSINVLAQGGNPAIGNKVLGSMAILSGMNEDGTPMVWGDTRPQPTEYTCVRNFDWPGQRAGFNVYESGSAQIGNLWQDIFAYGSAGLGVAWVTGVASPETNNNRIIRATVFNNGLDNPDHWGGIHTDAIQSDLDKFDSVGNSFIQNIYLGSGNNKTMNGEGARLTHRYVDGELTNEPLWPWPMEDRIQAELGISVTDMMTNLIFGTSDLSEIYP